MRLAALLIVAACFAGGCAETEKQHMEKTDTMTSTAEATCPVSGKPADMMVTSNYMGEDYHFCCEKCKAKFDANPEAFAKK